VFSERDNIILLEVLVEALQVIELKLIAPDRLLHREDLFLLEVAAVLEDVLDAALNYGYCLFYLEGKQADAALLSFSNYLLNFKVIDLLVYFEVGYDVVVDNDGPILDFNSHELRREGAFTVLMCHGGNRSCLFNRRRILSNRLEGSRLVVIVELDAASL